MITQFLLESARDGRTKANLQNAGYSALSRDDVIDGVPEMQAQVHVEATFLGPLGPCSALLGIEASMPRPILVRWRRAQT